MLDFREGGPESCLLWQLEEKAEKSLGELDSSAEGKGTLKKEREVHQKLLADSHGLVMDLRWQIHHREKNWNREKVELLERLDSERQEWGRQKEELLWRVEQVGVPQPQSDLEGEVISGHPQKVLLLSKLTLRMPRKTRSWLWLQPEWTHHH